MQLVNISSGSAATVADLVAANPLVSFPTALTAAMIEPFGFSVIQPTAMPVPPNEFYAVIEAVPVLVDGVWTQNWVTTARPLAVAQSTQSAKLDSACAAAIVSGFTSSALGAPHAYPSKMTDQQNLSASVLSSILPGVAADWTTPFWCADANGNWAWVPHTAAQIQQVGADGKAAIMACQTQNATLQAQLFASTITTVDQVAAIVWPA